MRIYYLLTALSLFGFASGAIGAVTVLRRKALLSDAVSHAALPGVCIAFLLTNDKSLLTLGTGALISSLLAIVFITLISNYSKLREDAGIGILIGCFFGLGIVLLRIIQNLPSGNRSGLEYFIFGKAANIIYTDLIIISILSLISLSFVITLRKEFKLLCFDPEYVRSCGWSTFLIDLILVLLVSLMTVAGLPAVGAVLMVALFVIPAVTARIVSNSFNKMVLMSGMIGTLMSAGGVLISNYLPTPFAGYEGWPTGPVIVLIGGGMLFVVLMVSSLYSRMRTGTRTRTPLRVRVVDSPLP